MTLSRGKNIMTEQYHLQTKWEKTSPKSSNHHNLFQLKSPKNIPKTNKITPPPTQKEKHPTSKTSLSPFLHPPQKNNDAFLFGPRAPEAKPASIASASKCESNIFFRPLVPAAVPAGSSFDSPGGASIMAKVPGDGSNL